MYKSNKFCDILKINKGITALIGSGGKTSMMLRLAGELCKKDRTVICTTTHIMRPEGIPVVETEEELLDGLERQDGFHGPAPVCVGSPAEEHLKLAAPQIPIGRLAEIAGYVLVEADGARRMPLKCHAAHEPVIPAGTDKVIWIIGLSGIGRTVSEAVHRPELFKEYTGLGPEDIVTAAAVAEAVAAEAGRIMGVTEDGHGSSGKLAIFINQADSEEGIALACELAAELKKAFSAKSKGKSEASEDRYLKFEIFAGSLLNGYICAVE